jgi:hypothetical protein
MCGPQDKLARSYVILCGTGDQEDCVIRESSHPYPESRPTTSDEPLPATRTVLKVRFPKNACELGSPEPEPEIERCPMGVENAREANQRDGRCRECAEDWTGLFSEEKGC